MRTIRAIYENGVFRPTEPVDLPEHSSVRVEPVPSAETADAQGPDAVTEALNKVYGNGSEASELDPLLRHAQAQTLKRNPD